MEGKPYVGAMPPISAVAEGTFVRTVLCSVVLRCGVVWCGVVCCVVLCCVVLCSILFCRIVQIALNSTYDHNFR